MNRVGIKNEKADCIDKLLRCIYQWLYRPRGRHYSHPDKWRKKRPWDLIEIRWRRRLGKQKQSGKIGLPRFRRCEMQRERFWEIPSLWNQCGLIHFFWRIVLWRLLKNHGYLVWMISLNSRNFMPKFVLSTSRETPLSEVYPLRFHGFYRSLLPLKNTDSSRQIETSLSELIAPAAT